MVTVGVITASDKGSQGLRKDVSGQTIKDICEKNGMEIVCYEMVPDEISSLTKAMNDMIKQNVNLILTTGGTGFSKRDVTPEATKLVIQREVPGIPEAIRSYSNTITKRAMLSRAVAGICDETLIINLPGSPKAVTEALTYILDTVVHGVDILLDKSNECARV